jgi:hypothetical protein
MHKLRHAVGLTLWLAASGGASAHEGHDHAGKNGKLTGEVVDITCFIGHEGKGDKHAACAQKCIAKGLPVGLLVGNTLYAVVLSSHDSPNEKLAPFAGKLVTMSGTIVEKSGMHVIDMDAVEPAAAPSR